MIWPLGGVALAVAVAVELRLDSNAALLSFQNIAVLRTRVLLITKTELIAIWPLGGVALLPSS